MGKKKRRKPPFWNAPPEANCRRTNPSRSVEGDEEEGDEEEEDEEEEDEEEGAKAVRRRLTETSAEEPR